MHINTQTFVFSGRYIKNTPLLTAEHFYKTRLLVFVIFVLLVVLALIVFAVLVVILVLVVLALVVLVVIHIFHPLDKCSGIVLPD